MILQLFSPPRPKTLALIYNDGVRYEYEARGRSFAARMPIEKSGYGFDDQAGNAPIVTSSPVGFAAPLPPYATLKGKMSDVEPVNADGADNGSRDAVAFTLNPEKEAHANAVFAAYCEFKRLEREAEERFGLGP